jgi:pyridinium-3,5-biscarboxylic acid mononucleotide synthase
MEKDAIRLVLEQVASGTLTADAAMERLRDLPFENLGFAHVDHHRALRTGHPEVIFCQGKSTEQVLAIAGRILARGSYVLATRLSPEQGQALARRFAAPEFVTEVDAVARTAVMRPAGAKPPELRGQALVLSAGTSDLPVAQEAAITARAMGARTDVIIDVGVAGIHRLLAYQAQLHAARVIVVAAGMEGALAGVVGGLVDVPVIAVPTSVGYGASFQGLAALLTMLNSCAAGVLVVNIDNGFGAGYAAALINDMPRSEPA